MKKVLLATLALSLVSGSALASSTPVTDIESGKSSVELNYSFNGKAKQDGIDSLNTKNNFGFSLGTALSDKLALQYSYEQLHPKMDTLVFKSSQADEFYDMLEEMGYPVEDEEEDPAAAAPAAPAAPVAPPAPAPAPADDPEFASISSFLKAKTHSLKAFYKLDENLNAYTGIDHVKIKAGTSITGKEDENKTFTESAVAKENLTGVSLGLVGHTKLTDKLTAFASVGLGTVVKSDIKLGLQYDVTKDLGLGLAYFDKKIKGSELIGDKALKHRGLSLAVNYKF